MMQTVRMPNTGAWQISDTITNGHDRWVEIRTFYGVTEREAVASYYNAIWSMGWYAI